MTAPNKNDYGIGIANVFYIQDKQGKPTIPGFTKFYYEPKYGVSGSDGTEKCIRIESH